MTTEPLIGRDDALEWLRQRFRGIADRGGSAAVVAGDAGIGKTALVAEFLREAPASGPLVVPGVESETAIPFGVLQRIVLSRPALLDGLPPAQAAALRTACGIAEGRAVEPALVGLALLSLLSRLGEDEPRFVWIDDAHWVDRESLQALTFAARRLQADRVGLVFTLRGGPQDVPELRALPCLTLAGLAPQDAGRLLSREVDATIDERLRERIVAETGGNPLALIDLGGELSAAQLEGRSTLAGPVPLGRRLEEHYLRQTAQIGEPAQSWLLLIAAEADWRLVVGAARDLGLTVDELGAAEAVGLVTRSGVEFVTRHPLVRSAVYRGASTALRERAHRALAGAAEATGDVERAVWHRALSTSGPDEPLAAALEELAGSAARRGGYATRTALLLRAAELSPSTPLRAERLVSAAESALISGAVTQAHALLDEVEDARVPDPAVAGRALAVRARLTQNLGEAHAFGRRPVTLAAAARMLFASDPAAARDALVTGVETLFVTAVRSDPAAVDEITATTLDLLEGRSDPTAVDLTLLAVARLIRSGLRDASGPLRDAVDLLLDPGTPDADVLACRTLGLHAVSMLWDGAARDRLGARLERVARARGALESLVAIVTARLHYDVEQGRVPSARERQPHVDNTMAALGVPPEVARVIDGSAAVAAWRGERESVLEALPAALAVCEHIGAGVTASAWRHAAMFASMTERRYAEAWRIGRDLVAPDPVGALTTYLPDMIECAASAGDGRAATVLLGRFETVVDATGSPWARGRLLRCRALVEAADPEPALLGALDVLATVDAPGDLARARLAYGEWLRRRRRRSAALGQLRLAAAEFGRLGALGWEGRARSELAVLGEASAAALVPDLALTPQERMVARLAADGATNVEIGEALFLSANTVDYHLRKIFRKLGITSRRRLRGVLDAEAFLP